MLGFIIKPFLKRGLFLFQAQSILELMQDKKKTAEEKKKVEKIIKRTCHVCGFIAKDASKLKRHALTNHTKKSDKLFGCTLCNKQFATKTD